MIDKLFGRDRPRGSFTGELAVHANCDNPEMLLCVRFTLDADSGKDATWLSTTSCKTSGVLLTDNVG